MSCNIQKKTLDYLKNKGLIEENRNIPINKLEEFNIENESLTKYAKDSKGVDMGLLFTIENKTIERKDKSPTLFINRAIPNNKAFEAIQKYNDNNIFEKNVNYDLKAVDILNTDKAKQLFAKGKKNGWDLNKILTELQIPKEQKQIILEKYKNKVSEQEFIKSIFPDTKVNQVVYRAGATSSDEFTELPTDYMDLGEGYYFSPNIEYSRDYGDPKAIIVNITKPKDVKIAEKERVQYGQQGNYGIPKLDDNGKVDGIIDMSNNFKNSYEGVVFEPKQIHILTEEEQAKIYNQDNLREEIITSLLAENSFVVEVNTAQQPFEDYETLENATYTIPSNTYANLTVPGGTNYTENEIKTPDITPSIKGHAKFATDNGIGWFRGDDQMLNLSNLENLGVIKKVPC